MHLKRKVHDVFAMERSNLNANLNVVLLQPIGERLVARQSDQFCRFRFIAASMFQSSAQIVLRYFGEYLL